MHSVPSYSCWNTELRPLDRVLATQPKTRRCSERRISTRPARFLRLEIDELVATFIPSGSTVLNVNREEELLRETSTAGRVEEGPVATDMPVESTSDPDSRNGIASREIPIELSSPRFDYVVAVGVVDHVYDVGTTLKRMSLLCRDRGRMIVVTYSRLWQPALRIAERMGIKRRSGSQNWIPMSELRNLSEQNGLELVTTRRGILVPFYVPLVSRWANRWLSQLPLIKHLSLVHVTVLRQADRSQPIASVSVIVPARNEEGNILEILRRVPQLAPQQEIIFVEGGSSDRTWEVITIECARRAGERGGQYLYFQQPGRGKGDAVRCGFAQASGDVLIILDADLSVPPEELPKFLHVMSSGLADFGNGSRLVYGMEDGAMRFLNLLGNKFFGALYTFLLGQPIRDTLCGTKSLWRDDYLRIASQRQRFGTLDPFGDFDLLLGAAGLNLRIRDVPIHYKARTYGQTNISRFRHGALLARMSWTAARKLRFV